VKQKRIKLLCIPHESLYTFSMKINFEFDLRAAKALPKEGGHKITGRGREWGCWPLGVFSFVFHWIVTRELLMKTFIEVVTPQY
jgi:hypothetical protein